MAWFPLQNDSCNHDAVFGPAVDGGYWLVGMKRRPWLRGVFADVRWSSPHALADTLANLAGRRVLLLDRLRDVDTGADLAAWWVHTKGR